VAINLLPYRHLLFFISELPQSIGNLSLLEDLQLGFNKLGSQQNSVLPPSMAQLEHLSVLALQSNEISVELFFIPVASRLYKLRTFHLQDNLLATPISDTILATDLKHIKAITLHGNPYHTQDT
jgi:hypothetical protein